MEFSCKECFCGLPFTGLGEMNRCYIQRHVLNSSRSYC
uniref:Uncharacterized protein n=1 Tax=Rhizophora mucronata TaxID=61149 RepID=A0A2P2N0C4_RHIMU